MTTRLWKSPLFLLITSKNSNSAAYTLGFSIQATNRLKIFLLKKAIIIINPDLWTRRYLPQIFYMALNKEFVVQKMIHAISLDELDHNNKSLVKALKVNCNLLASCRESESSILANLLRVLNKSPSSKFNSYSERF